MCIYCQAFGLYATIFLYALIFLPSHKKLGQHFKYKSITLPIKICHFGKQKHKEQSANVTAFSGTGLAVFAKVA